MMPVILWTDALVWLLVAAGAAYMLHVSRHAHLAVPWLRVTHSASGMAGLVVLLCFVLVGLMDSMHFRPRVEVKDPKAAAVYSTEVLSLLDVTAGHLRTRPEKTYSAPLATRSFAKELVEHPDGRQLREFPRLRHGGSHLKDEGRWEHDIFVTVLRTVALALVVWCALAGLIVLLISRRAQQRTALVWGEVWRGETAVPWRAVLLTLGLLLFGAFVIFGLSFRYHVFGTDKVGQDVLYLALKSIRTGLVIGTLTTLVTLPFGVLLGLAAGYFRGWVDDVIQYGYTTLNSIPSVLLIAAAVLMMQVVLDTHAEFFPTTEQRADARLLVLCVILGLTSWTGLARLLRGETLKLAQLEYIQAAHAFGVGHLRIIMRHILPNLMHIVLISLVMDFSGLVLAEAVLSYVGVGVDPSMKSFGTMINSARLEMARDPMVWWSLAAAFVFMFLMVLSANLFADAVRDAFDPRARTDFRPWRLRKPKPAKPAQVEVA
jgi:peptide/nickel transport system permease protein